ncbi:MAG: biotin transporter BioY [Parachlamydiaceae bacterium]|nr:biotin transporter BioY [Parachlamydiaceae bacterium]
MIKDTLIKHQNGFQKLAQIQSTTLIPVLLGSIFLAVLAQIAIPLPFNLVPITLQTFGVSILAITLGSKKASLSVLTYLIQATCGLPVLAGGISNPFWIIGPKVGYLIGFVIAAYVVGKLIEKQKKSSFLKNFFILSLTEVIILTLGTLGLGFFIGWESAFLMGFLPFVPGAVLKICMTTTSFGVIRGFK